MALIMLLINILYPVNVFVLKKGIFVRPGLISVCLSKGFLIIENKKELAILIKLQ